MTENKFRLALIKQFSLTTTLLLVQLIIFSIFSGFFIEQRSLPYFLTALAHYTLSTIIQFKLNPELMLQRLKIKREGSKLWDEVLMRMTNLAVIFLIPIFAGLDFRFHISYFDSILIWIGLIFVFASTVLLNWAMIINPHFEPTVRIQKDRNHIVIRSGPYNIIRHPGYLAGILFVVSIPFLIGSLFTFIPVGIYFILIILRTILEDNTLQKELEGYPEYVNQVKYRLFPLIW
jgi:protein-S-isoprenylcysteine O-methyltransferase Ste14